MKRPLTVWITQIVLILFCLLILFILVRGTVLSDMALSGERLTPRFFIALAVMLAIMVLLLIAFWSLATRRVYGRRLGVVSLVITWGIIVYTQLFPVTGPYQRYEYDNTAQLVGAFFSLSLIHALFLVLIIKLSFGSKVRDFFNAGGKDKALQGNSQAT
jgi:hypothetical protein